MYYKILFILYSLHFLPIENSNSSKWSHFSRSKLNGSC